MRTTLASLDTHVFQAEPGPPNLGVVLCHGYGAPGDDLVDLGPALVRARPELARARFFFPAAPLTLDLGFAEGRAWWPIDLPKLMAAQAGGPEAVKAFRNEEPPGLADARKALLRFVDAARRSTQPELGAGQLILGGFSQGAMLACDVALRLEEAPAGLALLSGTLLTEPVWRDKAARRAGLPVFQSHGRLDPVLPYDGAEALRNLLRTAGLTVTFVPFDDGHTIPPAAFTGLADFLAQRLPSAS